MTKAELYHKACMLPLLPGVYIIRDKSDTIIYIGKAKRLRIRVSQYFREGVPHDNKVSQMIAHAYAFDVIVCQSEFEALVLEASQIKAHTPKYNILLKDDKGYSYIRVTKEEWPRLSFTLQKEEDGAEYIGPYTSSFAARQMAETAMDAFLLPRCSKRFPQDIGKGRPCLNAHIGKCMAVCSGKISCENYQQAVKNAVHLIRYGKRISSRPSTSGCWKPRTGWSLRRRPCCGIRSTLSQRSQRARRSLWTRMWRWTWWRWRAPPAASARRCCGSGRGV